VPLHRGVEGTMGLNIKQTHIPTKEGGVIPSPTRGGA